MLSDYTKTQPIKTKLSIGSAGFQDILETNSVKKERKKKINNSLSQENNSSKPREKKSKLDSRQTGESNIAKRSYSNEMRAHDHHFKPNRSTSSKKRTRHSMTHNDNMIGLNL